MTEAGRTGGTTTTGATHTLIWFLLIFCFAGGIRILLYAGVSPSDDLSMANIAASIVEDGFRLPTSHYALRVGLTVPLAAVFAMFGVGESQLAALPLFFSLLGIGLAFAIGRQLAGPHAGLLAAVILAVFPLDGGLCKPDDVEDLARAIRQQLRFPQRLEFDRTLAWKDLGERLDERLGSLSPGARIAAADG